MLIVTFHYVFLFQLKYHGSGGGSKIDPQMGQWNMINKVWNDKSIFLNECSQILVFSIDYIYAYDGFCSHYIYQSLCFSWTYVLDLMSTDF